MNRARTIASLASATAAWMASSGCGLPLEASARRITNSCNSARDCQSGGACVPIGAGHACAATMVDLAGMLIEVRPSPNPSIAPNTSYILDPVSSGLNLRGRDEEGIVETYDPTLPALASIGTGRITASDSSCTAAQATDLSLSVNIEFDRVGTLSGLPAARYLAATNHAMSAPSFAFSLNLPPDVYDLYITPTVCNPQAAAPDPSTLPPAYIPSEMIAMSGDLNIALPPVKNLSGDITLPKGVSIANWIVDLVEPSGGRVISTPALLSPKSLAFSAHFENKYYWTFGPASPVLRLRPPDGVVGPTLYWDLSTIDINGDGLVALTLSDIDSQPKQLEAKVVDEAGQPVIANVTLESTELSGLTNASYKTTADTDAQGTFQAALLPGTYRVLARPSSDQNSLAVDTWSIATADLCCGRSVTVRDKALLTGQALTQAGLPMPNASIVAIPSVPPPVTYFNGALGQTAILPRQATGSPDATGAFALGVDSGQFDFSVRPRDGSLFPWLVHPGVAVAQGALQQSLGALVTSYPVIVRGTIFAPPALPLAPESPTVNGATVRAWLPVSGPDSTATPTAIQIGETTTDESGGYVLALPSSIAQ